MGWTGAGFRRSPARLRRCGATAARSGGSVLNFAHEKEKKKSYKLRFIFCTENQNILI
ncbi:hypothetical protein SSCG_06326 [Streptomyces clavuligerus]|nr:hypothetical protein SSCG_06326 [Streptomyces clavuligerus]